MDVDVSDDLLSGFVASTPPRDIGTIPAQWLSANEEAAFQQWLQDLPLNLAGYTFTFFALHAMSMLFTGRMDTSGMPVADKRMWHNKCAPSALYSKIAPTSLAVTLKRSRLRYMSAFVAAL